MEDPTVPQVGPSKTPAPHGRFLFVLSPDRDDFRLIGFGQPRSSPLTSDKGRIATAIRVTGAAYASDRTPQRDGLACAEIADDLLLARNTPDAVFAGV